MTVSFDVARAFHALQGKATGYDRLWQYYDGDQPVTYTASRLRELFSGLDVTFNENWCAVVVNAEWERLELQQPRVSDEDAQALLDQVWAAQELSVESDDAHQAALVCGEAYIIAWPDESGECQVYFNDPRLCHVFYDGENPRKVEFAAKWWDASDGRRRLTLYYAERLEYYTTAKRGTPSGPQSFVPADPDQAPNPYGQVPVFHLRATRRGLSAMKNALGPQDAINKLLADMMVAAEFGAFRQRWVITNADVTVLKNAPNEIWRIPTGDGMDEGTKVGEFEQTDLGMYLKGIEHLSTVVGITTTTPKHYFFAQSGDPSGEALIALEAPLNKKTKRRLGRWQGTWARLFSFVLQVQGMVVPPDEIVCAFDNPETVQPRTQAEIRQLSVGAGMPLRTVLREEGRSDAWIEQMDEDAAEERQQQGNIGEMLLQQFERGGGV